MDGARPTMSRRELFAAIHNDSISDLKKLISRRVDLNATENGKSALIRAIELQRIEMVELMMRSGVKTNAPDTEGFSAIHHVMMSGLRSLLQLFLVHRVPLSTADEKRGWTPLHYAVNANWFQAAEMLVYLGADTDKKDKNDRSPLDMCQDARMTNILTAKHDYERDTDIIFKNSGTKVHFENVDITFGSKEDFTTTKTFFVQRKYKHDEIAWAPKLKDDEEIWSDVSRFVVGQPNTSARLEFPLQEKPQTWDEIFLKYGEVGGEDKESVAEIAEMDSEWKAVVNVRLCKNGWFVLCHRLRSQDFDVSGKACKLQSDVDKQFELDIPTGACKGTLKLKVEPAAPVTKDLYTLLSLSKYCDITLQGGTQPQHDVTITMPLPEKYTGNGELMILSNASGSEDGDWTILDVQINVRNNLIRFSTKTFSIKVAAEVKKRADRKVLKEHVSKNFKRRNISIVSFFIFAKTKDSHQFDAIIECGLSKNLEKRFRAWEKNEYTCLRVSGMFKVRRQQKHRLELLGNICCPWSITDLYITYLPGKLCYQSLSLSVNKVNEIHSGTIKIIVCAFNSNKEQVLTYLPLVLDESAFKKHSKTVTEAAVREISSSFDDAWESTNENGILVPHELTTRLHEMIYDDWWKLWLYLGLSSTQLMAQLQSETSSSFNPCKQMLEKWFNKNSGERDFGISGLVCALQKVKNNEAISSITDYLSICKGSTECRDHWFGKPFLDWLDKQTLQVKQPVPTPGECEPMSDMFLTDLVSEHAVDELLALGLGLGHALIQSVTADTRRLGCQYTMFVLLHKFRSHCPTREDAFETLLTTLVTVELNETKEWAIEKTKQWIPSASENKASYAKKLQEILSRF